jgi:hypothetical protein
MASTQKNFNSYIITGLLVALPVVLLLLPPDYFDDGQSSCLSVVLFDTECYGCGMTRSIMHMIHLEFMEALYYNPLGYAVMPMLIWLYGSLLSKYFPYWLIVGKQSF